MSFGKDIRLGVEGIKKDVERTIRGAAFAAFKGIILSSPVDTGRFRANWFAAGANFSDEKTERTDKTGSSAVMVMAQRVNTQKSFEVFSLTNNLPYAERIELGWSQQAPSGIVRTNLKRVADNLSKGENA